MDWESTYIEVKEKEQRLGLLHKVSSLYYEKHEKKFKIAQQLGVSPTQVANLLEEAQREGIVKIEIGLPRINALEKELTEKFSLKKAIVIPGETNYDVLRKNLGQAAAKYFSKSVESGARVALSGGKTIFHMVEALDDIPRKIEIVPSVITARGPEILHIDAYVLATLLLLKSDWHIAKAFGVLLPPKRDLLKDDVVVAVKQLEREHNKALQNDEIKEVYEKMNSVDFLFTGSGDIAFSVPGALENPYSHATTLKVLQRRGLRKETLMKAGVIGDINYIFINDKCEHIISPYIGLGLDTMSKMVNSNLGKKVILVASSPYKIDTLITILSNALCNVFITDAITAFAVLSGN